MIFFTKGNTKKIELVARLGQLHWMNILAWTNCSPPQNSRFQTDRWTCSCWSVSVYRQRRQRDNWILCRVCPKLWIRPSSEVWLAELWSSNYVFCIIFRIFTSRMPGKTLSEIVRFSEKTQEHLNFSDFQIFLEFQKNSDFQKFSDLIASDLWTLNCYTYSTNVLANFPFLSILLIAQEYFGCGW